jgi:hypothetical protein
MQMVKGSQTNSCGLDGGGTTSANLPDVPDSQGIQALYTDRKQRFSASGQGFVNHVGQPLVNHGDRTSAGENGLTRLFKLKRPSLD